MDYSLVESDQHPGCSVSTYLKMQEGTFLLQTSKPFPDGWRGASASNPARAAQPGWLSMGNGGCRLEIDGCWEVAPSAWRERDASCAHLFPFAKHPQETWEVYGKASVLSWDADLPTLLNCKCWLHFSAAAAHSCLEMGSGPGEAAAGVGDVLWHVFLTWTFGLGSQRRQSGPLWAALDWGFSGMSQRETLGSRQLAQSSVLAAGFQRDTE